ncbi:MAG: hypothetical protein WD894_15420 [Pirellulales bacterium]
MDTTAVNGFSAQVELHLQVNGSRLRLSHVGQDMLIFREPQAIPAQTEGTLTVKIDDFEKQQKVLLYDGATLDSKRVKFRRC